MMRPQLQDSENPKSHNRSPSNRPPHGPRHRTTPLPLLPFWAPPRANIHGRWKCSSPMNGPNHTDPHRRSLSPTPPGSAPRSYAVGTARLPAHQQPTTVDTSRLQQILAHMTDFLDSMMHARTSPKQDAHLAQPLLEELAHQAEQVLMELCAANTGMAAAQALSSPPHASGQSLVTQAACTINQPTTQVARPASKLPVGQAGSLLCRLSYGHPPEPFYFSRPIRRSVAGHCPHPTLQGVLSLDMAKLFLNLRKFGIL